MFIRTIIFVIGIIILSYFHSEGSHGNQGNVTVYDFGASWCGTCRADVERDNALNREYGGKVNFVFVIGDSNTARADEFIKSTRPEFEVKRDPTHHFAESMGAANSIPSTVIIDAAGKKKVIGGALSKEALKSEIEKARKGEL